MRGLAVFPFQTKSMYSNLLSSFFSALFGNKKLSKASLFKLEIDSEFATGVSRPLGVKLLEDSTTPHIEWGKLTGVAPSNKGKEDSKEDKTFSAFFINEKN